MTKQSLPLMTRWASFHIKYVGGMWMNFTKPLLLVKLRWSAAHDYRGESGIMGQWQELQQIIVACLDTLYKHGHGHASVGTSSHSYLSFPIKFKPHKLLFMRIVTKLKSKFPHVSRSVFRFENDTKKQNLDINEGLIPGIKSQIWKMDWIGLDWIGCLTSQLTIFQSYMWRHIDVQADWRRSCTHGRAPTP